MGDISKADCFNLCVSSVDGVTELTWSDDLGTETAISPLNAEETALLLECETQVAENLSGHIKTAIALSIIQSKKLYRQEFTTFEAYLKAKFDISRAHGYRMIATGKAASQLSHLGDISKLPADLLKRFGQLTEKQKTKVVGNVTEAINEGNAAAIEKEVLTKAIDEVSVKVEPKKTKTKVNFTELLEKVTKAYEFHGDPKKEKQVKALLLELKEILGKFVQPLEQQG
jgi:predicted transcriptional regulator